MDAFCPHLGAHLGHGGTVDGCEIVCPFHGWQFDAEGATPTSPTASARTARRALRTYPDRRAQRPSASPGTTPTSSRADVGHPEARRVQRATPTGRPVIRTRYVVEAAWQEMAENGVDSRPLPLRAQHRDGARDRVVRRPASPSADAVGPEVPDAPRRDRRAHRRARRGPRASASSGSAGIVDTLNLAVHARRSTRRPLRDPLQLPRPQPGRRRDDLERRRGVRGRGRQAVPRGHSRSGSTRPTSCGRRSPTPTARS